MLGDDADGDKESLGAGLLPYKQASLIWQVLGEKHSDDVAAAKKKLQGIVDKSIAVRGVTVPLSVEGSSEEEVRTARKSWFFDAFRCASTLENPPEQS